MEYSIERDKCIGCGACAGQCPSGAIVPTADLYEILKSRCTKCGTCVDSCPVRAISKNN